MFSLCQYSVKSEKRTYKIGWNLKRWFHESFHLLAPVYLQYINRFAKCFFFAELSYLKLEGLCEQIFENSNWRLCAVGCSAVFFFAQWNKRRSLTPGSAILRRVWLQIVWYSGEFDYRLCDTPGSLTPGSAILCGVLLQAVRYSGEFDSRQFDTPRSLIPGNAILRKFDSRQCDTPGSLTPGSLILGGVWLQAVQYSAEFDSRQYNTPRSLTPGSAILCGVGLQAVRYSVEFDSRQCDTQRSLTPGSVILRGVWLLRVWNSLWIINPGWTCAIAQKILENPW